MDLKNQKGQAVLESILILVVMIFFIQLLIKGLKEKNYAENLFVKPWTKVTGMIECGAWQPCGVNVSNPGYHPNNRVVTYKPVNN